MDRLYGMLYIRAAPKMHTHINIVANLTWMPKLASITCCINGNDNYTVLLTTQSHTAWRTYVVSIVCECAHMHAMDTKDATFNLWCSMRLNPIEFYPPTSWSDINAIYLAALIFLFVTSTIISVSMAFVVQRQKFTKKQFCWLVGLVCNLMVQATKQMTSTGDQSLTPVCNNYQLSLLL